MLSVALFSLLVPAMGPMSTAASSAMLQQADPPIEIWVNKQDARLGDRVKVQARAESDGYLLVLHAEPDGRVRVLFPLDPVYDNFVRGGDKFEIRGRGDREAFRVYSTSGTGTVYAAFSRDPFRFEEFARGNHWDYGMPDTWWVVDDAEADLTNLASQMAGGGYFDYDLLEYNVWDENVASSGSTTHISYYGGYPTYSTWSFGIGFNWGWDYYPYDYYWYRPYRPWRYSYAWYPVGWWSSWYYDPWYYDWYYPYGYRYYSYYPRYYGGRYYTPTPYNDGRLRYYPTRLAASNSTTRVRRSYVPTSAAGRRLAASSSAAPKSRRVSTASRRTMPTVATRRDASSANGAVTRRTVDTARRTTSVTQPRNRTTVTTRQPSQQASPRRVTPTRRTTSRSQAAATRTTPSRSTPSARRTQTSRRVSPAARSTSRSTPSARRTSTPTVRRSQPAARSTSSVRRPSAPARSAPVRSTPRTVSRPSVSRPAAPRVSKPAPRRPSTSSSRPRKPKP